MIIKKLIAVMLVISILMSTAFTVFAAYPADEHDLLRGNDADGKVCVVFVIWGELACEGKYGCKNFGCVEIVMIHTIWVQTDLCLTYLGFFDPRIGRFTQPDPHWNVGNMQFGDTRVMRNGRLVPDAWAITQAGNLFVFGINNPVMFIDPTGLFIRRALNFVRDVLVDSWFAVVDFVDNNIPLASYIQALTGYDMRGSRLTNQQRVDMLMRGLEMSTSAIFNAYIMGGINSKGLGGVGKQITKSNHAVIRAAQGRNVNTAISDVQRARPADILTQSDGRWVVRGQNGRVHILEVHGEIVTTMNNKTNASVAKKIRDGDWSRLSIEEQNLFKSLFGNYVNWP